MTTVYEDLLQQMHDDEHRKFKFVCPECGRPNSYWEHSCAQCEAKAEMEERPNGGTV